MKKTLFSFLAASFLIITPSCLKNSEEFQVVITFIHGNLTINNLDADVGHRIQNNDILKTGDNSLAVIQIAQTAVITLRSNTELKIDSLINNKNISQIVSLSLNKGSTFHKIIRKGTNYSVKTVNILAAVRGTSFEVKTDETTDKISLLFGKVYVTKLSDAGSDDKKLSNKQNIATKEIELTSGQSLEVTSKGIGQTISLDQTAIYNLTQLDAILAIPILEKAIPQNDQKTVTPMIEVIPEKVKESLLKNENNDNFQDATSGMNKNEFIPSSSVIQALIKKEGRTMEDIKTAFQRIDEINLFSGRIIKGAVLERGAMYSIITTDGVVKISEKEIQSVKVIK